MLGVAPGWDEHEFQTLGMRLRERGRRTDEMLAALTRLLTERDVSFAGDFYRFESVTIEPRLSRFPELWVGGGSKLLTPLHPTSRRSSRRCWPASRPPMVGCPAPPEPSRW